MLSVVTKSFLSVDEVVHGRDGNTKVFCRLGLVSVKHVDGCGVGTVYNLIKTLGGVAVLEKDFHGGDRPDVEFLDGYVIPI